MTLRLAALLFLLVLAGCRSSAPLAPSAPTAEQARLEEQYWARVAQDRSQFEQADVDFMTGMIGHHAQALVMSAMAEPNRASPAVQTLAARIANAQRDEIAAMQQWLRDRDQPVPTYRVDGAYLILGVEGEPEGTVPQGHAAHDHASMPGMLSQSQLLQMSAARDSDFDRLFLAYMIQHHGGAVVMVNDLLEAGGATQDRATFKLASDIQADQRTEIERMQQMLDALGGPLPSTTRAPSGGHGNH
jgi:uncharacterized protein (DUF305 family)